MGYRVKGLGETALESVRIKIRFLAVFSATAGSRIWFLGTRYKGSQGLGYSLQWFLCWTGIYVYKRTSRRLLSILNGAVLTI